MSEEPANLENQVTKVEWFMVEKATQISTFSELMVFYQSYLSVFLPTLEFAINYLDENSICQLANFGILIDHLSSNQIDLMIDNSIATSAKEISEKTGKDEKNIIALLDNLAIAQKYQLSSTFIVLGSINRDYTIKFASSKLNVRNKAIMWANIFGTVSNYPIFIEFFLNPKVFDEAESDLKEVRRIISDKGRLYDAYFAAGRSGLKGLSEKNITEIPKMLIGTKLNWLHAMEGFYICKYLTIKKDEYIEKALEYNKRIQKFLTNKRVSDSEWAYRNLITQGPSPDLEIVLNNLRKSDEELKIHLISSNDWFIETGGKCFFIDIPTNFNFYFSPESQVKYCNDDGHEQILDAVKDVGMIVAFGNNPAKFVMEHLSTLCSPDKSLCYLNTLKRERKIEQYSNFGNTIEGHLQSLYNTTLSSPVLDIVKKGTKLSIEAMVAYGILISFEQLAVSAGIELKSEIWVQTRTIVSGIIVAKITNVFEKQKEKSDKENELLEEKVNANENGFNLLSTEEKIQGLYDNISKMETEYVDTVKEMNDDGLGVIFTISNKIREILLSGISPEEMKEELSTYLSFCEN
nr:hypothetical protein [uncultured Desulfobacter sp.]